MTARMDFGLRAPGFETAYRSAFREALGSSEKIAHRLSRRSRRFTLGWLIDAPQEERVSSTQLLQPRERAFKRDVYLREIRAQFEQSGRYDSGTSSAVAARCARQAVTMTCSVRTRMLCEDRSPRSRCARRIVVPLASTQRGLTPSLKSYERYCAA
jgi:hypothetical protein